MSLLFVDAGYFFFAVADRAVVFLGDLLHELVLEELRVVLEFLAVRSYSRLRGVDGPLHGGDHV